MATPQSQRTTPGAFRVPEAQDGAAPALEERALLPDQCREALEHLRTTIAGGREWPVALLEAMGLWTLAEEVYQDRLYRYLIQGEAFDWLLLAQRLAREADGLIPLADRGRLLRHGGLPPAVSGEEFKRLVGVAKYQSYLNYWYGVTVEAALQAAVRDEVRKERMSQGFSPRTQVTSEAFRRIYGESRAVLMERFLQGWEQPSVPLAPHGLVKEFTYGLFKERVQQVEKARVASDTRKGLEWLRHHHQEVLLWQAGAPGLDTHPDTLISYPEAVT